MALPVVKAIELKEPTIGAVIPEGSIQIVSTQHDFLVTRGVECADAS
jgi:hypothetical protein